MAKKTTKKFQPKFDWSGFWMLTGLGLAASAIGSLIFWATYTAPEGGPSDVNALSTTQRLARMLPDDVQTKLAFILAVLFIIFGVFLFLAGLFRAIRYILVKR